MTGIARRSARVGFVAAVFAAGWLCGVAVQSPAEAQVGDLGREAMKQAGEGGGPMGQAAKLGTTIGEMQENVTELQKSLETLNQIKAALGGG